VFSVRKWLDDLPKNLMSDLSSVKNSRNQFHSHLLRVCMEHLTADLTLCLHVRGKFPIYSKTCNSLLAFVAWKEILFSWPQPDQFMMPYLCSPLQSFRDHQTCSYPYTAVVKNPSFLQHLNT